MAVCPTGKWLFGLLDGDSLWPTGRWPPLGLVEGDSVWPTGGVIMLAYWIVCFWLTRG